MDLSSANRIYIMHFNGIRTDNRRNKKDKDAWFKVEIINQII